MSVRKNAKFLSVTEIENFVKACVLMKADIVNPGASPADRYSKWDEYTAIHQMIQFGKFGATSVNFGHGGPGAYSFLSWHRYFLYQFEKDLQNYVPGVTLPYWDWTDPASIMGDNFLGPNGSSFNGDDGSPQNNVVKTGFFAYDKPGSTSNPAAPPAWWPASLNGWRMPAFSGFLAGGLQRHLKSTSLLVPVNDIRIALNKTAYPDFQNVTEAGDAFNPDVTKRTATQMHNGMHDWVSGHMGSPSYSPHDPIFYMHHCNIDRLWAMWQLDGHQNEYPSSGGKPQHNRNDIMYPWTGGAAGYSTTASIATKIPMPDFSSVGAKRNVDTLDFRSAFGYTYDTIAIMGIALDRTGSMNGMTPDPMVSGAPDVTKWEAAKRGISAFLQDCETAQDSGAIYVSAGIKTFRSLPANDFASVFSAPGYGLVKAGTSFSKSTFDAAASAMTPGGGTPLADALVNVENDFVEAPYSGLPADEQRYLAMLTDGMLTSGSPMSSIPDHSFTSTAVFAMGFGTGADVDYTTLASIAAKGKTLSTQQIFHGENAGTIDKFFSNALAAAIGFTSVFDPLFELFAGEHTHVPFYVTSAEDTFMLTAQGMDFIDSNWHFMLHAPDGEVLYTDIPGHHHSMVHMHECPPAHVTARKSNGRLTLVVQKGNADGDCWSGQWTLMIFYKTVDAFQMMMPALGEMLYPVAAGPIRGATYSRLLTSTKQRTATRNIASKSKHVLDDRANGPGVSTGEQACNILLNIYARTNLKITAVMLQEIFQKDKDVKIVVKNESPFGSVQNQKGIARIVYPVKDVASLISKDEISKLIAQTESKKAYSHRNDVALLLANIEKNKKGLILKSDNVLELVNKKEERFEMLIKESKVTGTYHIGLNIEGIYYPDPECRARDNKIGAHDEEGEHHHHPGEEDECPYEYFSRILNVSFIVAETKSSHSAKGRKKPG